MVAMEYDMFGRKPAAERLYIAMPSVLPYNKLTLHVGLDFFP